MADKEMVKGKIKIVFRYVLALTIPAVLCAYIMIPSFTALLLATGLLEICPDKFVPLVSDAVEAVAVGISGFIMSLLISWLARDREIMTTLAGALMVIAFYAVFDVVYFESMSRSHDIPEGFWRYMLPRLIVNAIVLLGCALIGAWLIGRRRRLREEGSNE